MSVQSKLTLKTYFQTGDKPTEQQFINLIDSLAHVDEVGLTIDDTEIESGIDGAVLFEQSGILSQSSNFLFDYSTNRLSLAMGGSPGARLDIKAAGALSSDVVFRLRNSANTQDLFKVAGDASLIIYTSGGSVLAQTVSTGGLALGLNATTTNMDSSDIMFAPSGSFTNNGNSRVNLGVSGVNGGYYGINIGWNSQVAHGADGGVALGPNARANASPSLALGMGMRAGATNSIMIGTQYGGYANNNISNSLMFHLNGTADGNYQHFFVHQNTNVVLRSNTELTSGTHFNATATNIFTVHNGTLPDGNIADAFQFGSEDIAAGNAAPYFITENGDKVKLYSIGGWGTPSGTLTRTTYTTFAGQTISAVPTQTEVQNIDDHVVILSERLAALISDLKTGHQLLKA